MTKLEEMARYDAFLRTLPEDSYLRPWLAAIRDEVASDLRSDIIPECTPRETYHQCRQIRADSEAAREATRDAAAREADRIIAHSTAAAKDITDRAERIANATRRELQSDLDRLRSAILGVYANAA